MRIGFYGGVGTVTGSCFLVTAEKSNVLVDCGLFQGPKKIRERNNEPFSFRPANVDYVVLTHSHIDHSGLIPRLTNEGFKGRVIATRPTVDLARIMLPDSGHIHETEAEWTNRKRVRAGLKTEPPIYTIADAEASLNNFLGVNYDEVISLSSSIKIRLRDAGHILGSAIVEMWLTVGEKTTKIVFSGDLGNGGQPIVRDPTPIDSADFLVLESTYGNRLHEPTDQRGPQLAKIINETVQRDGNVIIPAFAIERTQDLLYDLGLLYRQGDIPRKTKTYVDSPLATKATEIFIKHPGYYDYETLQLLQQGYEPLSFENLNYVRSVEESKRLNSEQGASIIISASGMCDAGRIKHHLKHNLWRPECSVVLVGYQAEGTLGRRLLDGAKRVRIFGEQIAVKAQIYNLSTYSAHADQLGLLEWVKSFQQRPKCVFLVHGEKESSLEMAKKIESELEIKTLLPTHGRTFSLEQNDWKETDTIESFKSKPDIDLLALQSEMNELIRVLSPKIKQDLGKDIAKLADSIAKLRLKAKAASKV